MNKQNHGLSRAAHDAFVRARVIGQSWATPLIEYRVSKGNRRDESETMFADLLFRHDGDNLQTALVYESFGTERATAEFCRWLRAARAAEVVMPLFPIGQRVYAVDMAPYPDGWYILHRARTVSGEIETPDTTVTLCLPDNAPGDYVGALASQLHQSEDAAVASKVAQR